MKFITKTEQFTPICVGSDNKYFQYNLDTINSYGCRLDVENQFKWDNFTSNYLFYHYSNSRMQRYKFLKGIVFDYYGDGILAMLCENGKVLVRASWIYIYPTDFKRFKKMLKENGINVKKDIHFVDNFVDYVFNPFSPSMMDYDENHQKQLSEEFLQSIR